MTTIFHSSLSRDLSSLLNESDDFNVTIKVGEDQNTKEFYAHSLILRARSPYFKRALSNEWIEMKDNMIFLNKPNISPTVFDMILKYIYAGEINLTKQSGEDLLGLLVASDELFFGELFHHAQDYLIEHHAAWLQQNFVLVLHTVFKLVNCKKLQDYCLESICEDAQSFITSTKFPSLDKDILYGLLKRDELQVDEVVVWSCLIKWGIEQTPGLGSENDDRSKWNNENYEALKGTLNDLVPLIRFTDISPNEYFDKVRPYKAVIPNHIYEEIEEFYFKGSAPKTTILPPRKKKQETSVSSVSKIIKSILFNIIIDWINKKDSSSIDFGSDYDFDLIYRKSRDGDNIVRKKCAGQGSILILIKVKYSDKIFGGYNPIGWDNKYDLKSVLYHSPTADSFIFSFENEEDNKNMMISRVINSTHAVENYSGVINFGDGDLYLAEDYLTLSCSGYYEDNLNANGNEYEVEEIEAFSVNKK